MTNPFDTPRPRGTRLLQGTLRVIVALQCWGTAAARIHQHEESPVQQLLENAYAMQASQVAYLQDSVAYFLIFAGLITLFRPAWLLLIPILIWHALTASCVPIYGTGWLDMLWPIEQAPLFIAPLSLMLIDFWPPDIKTSLILTRSAASLLQLAAAATFLVHGGKLVTAETPPEELTRLIEFAARHMSWNDLEEGTVRHVVQFIGIAEVAAGVAFLSSRNRMVAVLLVAWGLVSTLLFALVHRGAGYHTSLILAGTWGAPLFVLQFWLCTIAEQPPNYLPEEVDTE
ncbi:MAG: hypothetical protein H6824_18120 [Planctomycetaceae bacterium]|nr:hypothetical protein [Planctomycetaceae bacterium]